MHIDGFIAVVAHTLIVGAAGAVSGPAADVVLAAYHAAEAAVKSIKPGSTNEDVTSAVKAVSECYGVNSVQGVLMHQMKRHVREAALSLPLQGTDRVSFCARAAGRLLSA